jgi:hypothetical protein
MDSSEHSEHITNKTFPLVSSERSEHITNKTFPSDSIEKMTYKTLQQINNQYTKGGF